MKVLNSLKLVKWWEYLYIFVFLAVLITLSIVYKSSALVIANSIVGVIAVFFISKGMVIGNILGIVSGLIYIVISFLNAYYGEIIVSACITLPSYIFSIYTWLKNRNKGDEVVKVNKGIKLKEWLLILLGAVVIGISFYFILRAFNTASLVISTLSVATASVAGYLLARRCEFSFIFFLINNVLTIVLWVIVAVNGDATFVPTITQFVIFALLNICGLINWLMIKNKQAKQIKATAENGDGVRGDLDGGANDNDNTIVEDVSSDVNVAENSESEVSENKKENE